MPSTAPRHTPSIPQIIRAIRSLFGFGFGWGSGWFGVVLRSMNRCWKQSFGTQAFTGCCHARGGLIECSFAWCAAFCRVSLCIYLCHSLFLSIMISFFPLFFLSSFLASFCLSFLPSFFLSFSLLLSRALVVEHVKLLQTEAPQYARLTRQEQTVETSPEKLSRSPVSVGRLPGRPHGELCCRSEPLNNNQDGFRSAFGEL